jgi:hypothetical protein
MSKDNFQWDDKLVTEIVAQSHRDGFHQLPLGIYDRVQDFKASHQPKEPSKPEKDWEIVAYSCWFMGFNDIIFRKEENGNFRTFDYRLTPDQKQHAFPEDAITNSKIHSVKRLSDNEVFSVGDELCELGWFSDEKDVINKITIINDAPALHFGKNGMRSLSSAKKSKPIEKERPVLFTTEDGVIVENPERMIFYVSDMRIRERKAKNAIHLNNKRFYQKEKAEEYVLMNKRCFSVTDIIDNLDLFSVDQEKMIGIAKQKQTHQ